MQKSLRRKLCFIAGAFEAGMGVNTLHYQKLISDFTVILNFIEAVSYTHLNTLYKMKELWVYLGESFPEEQFSGSGKLLKRIRKASSIPEYQAAVALLDVYKRQG